MLSPTPSPDRPPDPDKSTLRIGSFRVAGIPIRLHLSFVALFLFLVVVGIGGDQSAALSSAYVLALFTSVFLHEVGHVMVARLFGIRIKEIVMYPIGGVSKMETVPAPQQEFWIALSGPAVNLILGGAIFTYLVLTHQTVDATGLTKPTAANLLQRVGIGNIIVAAFNLIPAFPMDGGRVLRALLARTRSPEDSTRIAVRAGQVIAYGLGLYGLVTLELFLVFIALFIYLGAAQEGAAVLGQTLMRGVPVRAAMVTEFHTLPHGSTLRDAADLLLATSQQDFPIVLGSQVMGLLSRNALLRGMANEGPEAYVAGIMDRAFLRFAPDLPLLDALRVLNRSTTCALVMDGDVLAGLLTTENLNEFLILRQIGLRA